MADQCHAQAWQAFGVMEMRAGNFKAAKTLFECGLKNSPTHGALWQAYGTLESWKGNISEARLLFAAGIAKCPQHVPLYQAWACLELRSEFCDNEELSSEYHITLDDAEQSFIAMYDTDLNNENDDYDCEIACINSESLGDRCSTKPMSKRVAFARCDSVGVSAFDLLHRRLKRCYRLSETPTKKSSPSKAAPFSCITESAAFSHVLSFLNEGDLVHSVSFVSTRFADVAAEALGLNARECGMRSIKEAG
ncbi:hypothetical protein ACHAWU_006730 [Discostella pseudostelligera]|uniref:Uncharacterized protein n=1 Tax=Discostella pseudostelligera TaxID=259834 RepID=A0ABD3LYA6_9STRA